MKHPGITAIAHPASFEVANTHGVFIVDQVQQLIEKYKQGMYSGLQGGEGGVGGREEEGGSPW